MSPDSTDDTYSSSNPVEFQPYSIDQLRMTWRQFAFRYKQEGKETLFSALTKRDAVPANGDNYTIEVDNSIQLDAVMQILPEFNAYLRTELRNHSIAVQVALGNADDADAQFLSPKDKFNKLARKNSNLHTLKQRFNLDFEY